MDKLASCLLQHGATPKLCFNRSTSLLTPGPGLRRRSVSVSRSASTHAGVIVIDRGSGAFDFERYLSRNAEAVHDALDAALSSQRGCPARLGESMRYSVLGGGKFVRPVLAIAACELVGGSTSAAIPVACAAEMIHVASLVHDDMPCMDDDALRRGRASCHVAFGEPAALLAGDALLALAFEHLACAAGVPADRALRAVAELGSAAGVGGIASGQAADMASEGAADVVSLATLEYIHVHKTARLLEAAAVSGAVVGGGGDGEVESVRRYARAVGLLFQVVDDVLDVTRTSEQLGKTAGKDAVAGKATYPRLMGVEGARAYAAELLARAEAELEGFDAERAPPLRHLARFVAYRRN